VSGKKIGLERNGTHGRFLREHNDAVRLLEERHAEAVAKRERQMEHTQDWIHKIKAREVVLDSEKAHSAQKLAEETAARESKCQEAVISLAPMIVEMASGARGKSIGANPTGTTSKATTRNGRLCKFQSMGALKVVDLPLCLSGKRKNPSTVSQI